MVYRQFFRGLSNLGGGRTFSGIQPTGVLHLGNYFGAVQRWARHLDGNNTLYSIVDLHAITLPQNPQLLRKNILEMAASLIACGVDPQKCVLFQQSKVPQHTELCWILGTISTVPQLGRLSQYKEKSSKLKEVPLGLYIYPVLQSADILLYKATQIPVGEDNLQNVEVCRDIAKSFNARFKTKFFRLPQAVLTDNETCRLKSLRNPEKKMSKSDPDQRSFISITDTPEVILDKCKKAMTDFTSEVTFDPASRPGVSNLLLIHSGFIGQSPEEICREVSGKTTAEYKLILADVIVEHLKPIKERVEYLIANEDHLENILNQGAETAAEMAESTMVDIRKIVGFRA